MNPFRGFDSLGQTAELPYENVLEGGQHETCVVHLDASCVAI